MPHQREDLVLLAHIRSAFTLSNKTYGSPRMTRELQDEGLKVGRRRTARLMRENGLKARPKRRFKRTTDSHHGFPVAPNLLAQDFSATRPNQKWNADISYGAPRPGRSGVHMSGMQWERRNGECLAPCCEGA